MGSAAIQGRLWGACARDWAEVQEQTVLPLFGAVLDAARVSGGSRLLDAGCGAGLTSLLAALRGADVTGIDASAELLDIARCRHPAGRFLTADLEELPFPDASFDAVIAVNSLFYAADPRAALRELVRVARPGARIVITSWGPAEQCEYGAVMRALGPLLPPPPPNAPAGGPFAYSAPGALEALLAGAGLDVAESGAAACAFAYPDLETSWRGQASSGITRRAIGHSGLDAVRAAIAAADRAHEASDGTVRYDNVFIWAAGAKRG